MRIAPILLAIAASGFLAACTSEEVCTVELAQKKATDLTMKLAELATANPARLIDLGPKVQELAARATTKDAELQDLCKSLDEAMAELSK